MTETRTLPPVLRRSAHLSTFAHMGDVYLFHDLYGYIMKMSPDVLAVLDAFAAEAGTAAVMKRFAGAFEGQQPEAFVDIFLQFACLVEPDEDELENLWPMVVIKGRWNVWHRDDDGGLTLYTAWGATSDSSPVKRHVLSPAEARMWDDFDGERRLNELHSVRGHDRAGLLALIRRIGNSDTQAVKLSPLPMSAFKGRRNMIPPYLGSTMPYARWRAGDPVPTAPVLESYHREDIRDAEAQFDHQETTLSHLFRRAHPALAGRTYGEALVDALAARGALRKVTGTFRVLEIGGGLGYVAAAVTGALAKRGLEVGYEIVELAPALAAAQRRRCEGLPVTVREGDGLKVALDDGAYDLIIANEMIGDLPAVELTHAQVGANRELEPAARAALLAELGEVGELITTLELQLDDAPDPFHLNVGALALQRRITRALAPGGTAVVTEFGDRSRYPRLSTHLDHPELSIHFGHLERAAERDGLRSELVYVIDLIDLDRSQEGLATTRSYFRALGALLAERGVTLEKIGYTRAMVDELLAGKVAAGSVGELHFEKIEDRLMGLVPHEFKALLLQRSAS